jgi:predicted Fe-Mo cluster-binding NifX family protein
MLPAKDIAEEKTLFHAEEKSLADFKSEMKKNRVSKKGLAMFVDNYNDLLTQSKVITRVSDRLQSKLNKANEKIATQNEEIVAKNDLLKNTINHLVKATVSKKAMTIIFTAAIILFVAEEILLESAIKAYINIPYIDLILKLIIALVLKSFESTIEKFFMRREQSKIVDENLEGEQITQVSFQPQANPMTQVV